MQKKLAEIRKRRAQAQMDKVLRQRRERKRLKPQSAFTGNSFQQFFYVPVEITVSSADALTHVHLSSASWKIYPILISITSRKNTHYFVKGKIEQKREHIKTKKNGFLEL